MSRRSSESLVGKRRTNGLKDHSGAWEGFVDIALTSQQKEHLASLEQDDLPDVWLFLVSVVEEGYKVSLVNDEKHACCIATLTGRGSGCLNAGFSLSARGPDVFDALVVLHFKHVVLCDRQVWAGHADANTNQLSLWG